MEMTGTYDRSLVILSILIAAFASYTALSLANRIRAAERGTRRVWLAAAAVAMGGGIWSMHFVAMLAFSVPGMSMSYDAGLTLLSLGLAVVFTGVGFSILGRRAGRRRQITAAGMLMGLGIVAMHYVGMAAMRMDAQLRYEQGWFALSIAIAIGAAIAALWLASRDQTIGRQIAAACVMGLAISGMHYTGMQAALFTHEAHVGPALAGADVNQANLAAAIAAITLIILLLASGAAWLERRFQSISQREARMALGLRVADLMRDRSTDDALRDVAALMGEHFRVSRTGYARLDPVEDVFDYQVCWTDGTVAPLLGRHAAGMLGGKVVAELSAGRPVAIEDIFSEPISNEAKAHENSRELDTRAALVVPFVRGGRLRTIFYLADRETRRWQADDVRFMQELAERTRLIVERAEAEEQLRQLNATLEKRVLERTAELRQAEEALRQSQKMEAIGQLSGGMAHDFNNILAGVMGALGLIQRRIADGRTTGLDKYIEDALATSQRGANLIARLLAFSRRRPLDAQPSDVNALVASLEELLARTMGPQIKLSVQTDAEVPFALVDPNELEAAIVNLAINARDAMPDGGTLLVRTEAIEIDEGDCAGLPETTPGRYAAITLSDTGTGIAEEDLERVFEPFFTTKPVGQGTGLGLSMVYGFARQSGGQVRIGSRPGEGTSVTVYLPATEKVPRREATPLPVRADGAGRSVLLVEDDGVVRTLVRELLDDLGCTTAEADSGDAALALLADDDGFDLLITDVGLPGMNGRQLADAARARLPGLPVLFMTGYAEIAACPADFLGPRMQLIGKPFTIEALTAAIGQALGTGSSRKVAALRG